MRSSIPFLLVLVVLAGCAAPREEALPASMAALGDSITRAMNTERSRMGDAPEVSWATGGGVSHARRLADIGAPLEGRVWNLARSGAVVADLPDQARLAVERQAEHVTVHIGANDACAPSIEAMTSEADFRADVRGAFDILQEGLPEGATVYVLSIPDIHRLREVVADDQRARMVWRAFGICQSVLGENIIEEEGRETRARIIAYNAILREEAEARGFAHDDGAVFAERFTREHVSPLDHWHPSLAGQARLSEVAWRASPFHR